MSDVDQQEIERLREHIRHQATYVQVTEHAFVRIQAELHEARREIERLKHLLDDVEHANAGDRATHPFGVG